MEDISKIPVSTRDAHITSQLLQTDFSFQASHCQKDLIPNKLRDIEAKHHMILENIKEGYFEASRSGEILVANDSMHRIFGFSEKQLIGASSGNIFAPDEISRIKSFFRKICRRRLPLSFKGSVLTIYGDKLNIEAVVAPVLHHHRIEGFTGIVLDQTAQAIAQQEKTQLEYQLHQSQKMEAIGTLAGGIAHDFNNILMAIIGYTEISIADISPNTLLCNNLKRILNAGKRARDLIRQILTFSRQTNRELLPISIQSIVKEALKLLRASLPSTIKIETRFDSNAAAMADPTQIHQILINLCTNASHAMQEQGGTLKVSLEDTDLTASFCSGYPDITPGRYINIRIADTGVGIPPDIVKKIFEPFFTTKERNKGTGLGLAVVHGIVKSHNGLITVSSDTGVGTTFDVYIPVAAHLPESISDIARPLPTGSEHILFVDDEIIQTDMARQMLERLGYRVTAHHCGQKALNLFHHRPDQFDMVITDMTMPKITGDVLAQEILHVRPDIPIILCTGYSERINEEKALSLGAKGFMMKPFLMKEMALLIRNILETA